jgi:hypothetical protein
LTNNGLAHILGAFFTNSSGRTASMQQITWKGVELLDLQARKKLLRDEHDRWTAKIIVLRKKRRLLNY